MAADWDFWEVCNALTKKMLIAMAHDLRVENEIEPGGKKALIISDLSEVLTSENVRDWADWEGAHVASRLVDVPRRRVL